jgi:thioredoxin 1
MLHGVFGTGGDTAKAMSAINDVTQASFESEVLKNGEPVLVDFWAPWCGPCRMLSPVVEKVSQKFAGKAKFVKLNTDENPSLAGHYGISGIPCLILFKGGQVVDRIVGYVPENAIVSMLAKHVAA